MKAVMLFV